MSIKKDEISFPFHDLIDSGVNGEVFSGTARGKDVAVKRIQLISSNPSWADVNDCLEFVRKMNDLHVISISDIYEDDDFRYLIFL
jgi:hypothetical protein